jgi:hypothetical protein
LRLQLFKLENLVGDPSTFQASSDADPAVIEYERRVVLNYRDAVESIELLDEEGRIQKVRATARVSRVSPISRPLYKHQRREM